jgi:hypothetical protein
VGAVDSVCLVELDLHPLHASVCWCSSVPVTLLTLSLYLFKDHKHLHEPAGLLCSFSSLLCHYDFLKLLNLGGFPIERVFSMMCPQMKCGPLQSNDAL